MAKRGFLPGWARIGESEFKAAVATARASEPDIGERLRRAIRITAGQRVATETVTRYLGWLAEAEMGRPLPVGEGSGTPAP